MFAVDQDKTNIIIVLLKFPRFNFAVASKLHFHFKKHASCFFTGFFQNGKIGPVPLFPDLRGIEPLFFRRRQQSGMGDLIAVVKNLKIEITQKPDNDGFASFTLDKIAASVNEILLLHHAPQCNFLKKLVAAEGFEPPTKGL